MNDRPGRIPPISTRKLIGISPDKLEYYKGLEVEVEQLHLRLTAWWKYSWKVGQFQLYPDGFEQWMTYLDNLSKPITSGSTE